jgi:hypothetical protein
LFQQIRNQMAADEAAAATHYDFLSLHVKISKP